MNLKGIKTKHDKLINELFEQILEALGKTSTDKGFPYIEHDLANVQYYPNWDTQGYEKFRTQFKNEVNPIIEQLNSLELNLDYLIEPLPYQQLQYQDVFKLQNNTSLDYILFQRKFNHIPISDTEELKAYW